MVILSLSTPDKPNEPRHEKQTTSCSMTNNLSIYYNNQYHHSCHVSVWPSYGETPEPYLDRKRYNKSSMNKSFRCHPIAHGSCTNSINKSVRSWCTIKAVQIQDVSTWIKLVSWTTWLQPMSNSWASLPVWLRPKTSPLHCNANSPHWPLMRFTIMILCEAY